MAERPRFFDDLAGVAGGAFSALSGLRDELETTVRARVEDAIRKLDLVKREDLDAVQEMAAAARTGQEAAEARIAALEAEVARLGAAHAPTPARPDPAVSGTESPPAAMPAALNEAGTPTLPPAVD